MEFFLTILYVSLFSIIIYKSNFFEINGLSRKWVLVFFIVKIAAGIALYFVYLTIYPDRNTADIFKYFDDSRYMYEALWDKPIDYFKMMTGIANDNVYFDTTYYSKMNHWYREFESNIYNDSHTIIRFNALIRIFSFGYYNVHTVFMSFISFVGLFGIYKFLQPYLQNKEKLFVFFLFLCPSIALWTSGVLKEGLLVFGMGMLLYSLLHLSKRQLRIRNFLLLIASLLLLVYTKYYILMILIPLLIPFYWNKRDSKIVLLKYAIIIAFSIIAAWFLHLILPEYNILYMLAHKQKDFYGLAMSVNSGSIVFVPALNEEIFSFIKATPFALFNTLFRPHFGDISNLLALTAFAENITIIILILLSIRFRIKPIANFNILWFSVFFILATFLLIGFTTPVLGAIVRYKVPTFPFVLFIIVYLMDKKACTEKLRFLKNFLNKKNKSITKYE